MIILLAVQVLSGCVDRHADYDAPELFKEFDSMSSQLDVRISGEIYSIVKPEVVLFSATYVGKTEVAQVQTRLPSIASNIGYGIHDGKIHAMGSDAALFFCHKEKPGRYITWSTSLDSTVGHLELQSEGLKRNYPYCSK